MEYGHYISDSYLLYLHFHPLPPLSSAVHLMMPVSSLPPITLFLFFPLILAPPWPRFHENLLNTEVMLVENERVRKRRKENNKNRSWNNPTVHNYINTYVTDMCTLLFFFFFFFSCSDYIQQDFDTLLLPCFIKHTCWVENISKC